MRNVFFDNVDKSLGSKAIHDPFSAFGNILSCEAVCDENGPSGYAFVHLEAQEAGDRPLLLDDYGVLWAGSGLPRVRSWAQAKEFTNAHFKNFKEEVNDESLKELFSQFVETLSVKAVRNPSEKSKCFDSVSCEKHEDAGEGLEEVNGKVAFIGPSQKIKSEWQVVLKMEIWTAEMGAIRQYQEVNLYIKELGWHHDDKNLSQELSPFRSLTWAEVMLEEGKAEGLASCVSPPLKRQSK